jgi:hypothetical protein
MRRESYLADTVRDFEASRHLVGGSRSGRKEDELSALWHQRPTCLEESEVAENLRKEVRSWTEGEFGCSHSH